MFLKKFLIFYNLNYNIQISYDFVTKICNYLGIL